jgi:glucose dehydrogenase
MRVRKSSGHIVAAIGVALIAIAACSKQDGKQGSLAQAGKDWPTIGGGPGNTHFSTLDQINAGNVKNLGAAWAMDFGEAVRGTPVVANGKMYIATAKKALALDPKTGATIWSKDLPFQTYGLFKGVSLGEGLVFVGLGNSHIVALKQDTGEQVWEAIVGDGDLTSAPIRGQFIAGGPNYANGIVVSGLANADYGIQGRVVAFDAKTGQRLWRFNTTPMTPQEPGANTWTFKDGETKIGGGGVWSIPVIDPDLNLVYFGVGNPTPGYSGELRPGDNLYSDSLVALDLKTGAVKWHFQTTHHDIWEADLGTPIILYDATVDGKQRKAVAAATTYGHIFMFDRATGEPIFPIEERPVPQSNSKPRRRRSRSRSAQIRSAPLVSILRRCRKVGRRCACMIRSITPSPTACIR